MHCARHPDREAVGLCRVCLRGVCADCAVDFGTGFACRGVHEEAFGRRRAAEDRRLLLADIADRSFARRRVILPVARAVWFVVSGLALMGAALIDPVLTPWVIGAAFTLAGLWALLPDRGEENGAPRRS